MIALNWELCQGNHENYKINDTPEESFKGARLILQAAILLYWDGGVVKIKAVVRMGNRWEKWGEGLWELNDGYEWLEGQEQGGGLLDYCGRSVQPTLLNEAYRRPLQYRFLALSLRLFAVQRFGADLVHALESHYFIPCLLSILSVLYHIAPVWWGGWRSSLKDLFLSSRLSGPMFGPTLWKQHVHYSYSDISDRTC